VSGAALGALLTETSLRRELLAVSARCRTVLACRVSPKQKADVVGLVKEFEPQAVTLSIGDGANDVSMIVQAHVGVGLSGKEGAQAAQAADFAISEFRLLRRLLFVHGRESYRRNALVVLYNFYKNQLGVFPQVLFALHSAFSARFLFHPGLQQLYNIFFTHMPICLYGLFDRATLDLTDLERDPRNFAPTYLLSSQTTLRWVLAAALQATFVYVMIFIVTEPGRSSGSGQDISDLFTVGVLGYGWVILCANLTMAMRHTCWFFFTLPALCFGVSSYVMFVGFCAHWDMPGFNGVLKVILLAELPRIFLGTLLLAVGHVLLGEVVIGRRMVYTHGPVPTDEDDKNNGSGLERTPTIVEMQELQGRSRSGSRNPLASSSLGEGLRLHQTRRSSTGCSSAISATQTSFMFSMGMSQECALERDQQGLSSCWDALTMARADSTAAAASGEVLRQPRP